MASSDLLFTPIPQLAALLKSRKLSPVELVRACLGQIEALNPRVNAFLTVTASHALAQAAAAEKEISAGRYRGPLHGIPYAPKDIFATKGIRTTNGSRVTADWVPDFESAVTERLNRAGAIMLGKLNLLEFAMGSGQNGLNGPARNPWDLAYSPSGSSSGSGAAVAAGMVPFTIGSDSGGSIRGPAKSCGVVGLKPTYGRVSRHGCTTLSWTLDHAGPLAKTVAGVATVLEAMAGADHRDDACSSSAVPAYALSLTGNIKGIRIGVPTEHFFTHVEPETEAALRQARSVLKERGAVEVDITVRNAALTGVTSSTILSSEGAAYHEQRLKKHAELFDPLVRERLEAATFNTAVDYIKALRMRTMLMQEMNRVFQSCDVILLPAGNPPPRLEGEIAGTDVPTDPPAPPRPDTFNLANVTGVPALVLPCGFTAGPPVLPIGIQFYARPFDESTLFRVAHAYESATGWHKRTPPLAG
ncbi:MAG: amidase [Acidobacteriota bacterium]